MNLAFYRFPEHFEVRFTEHLRNLCNEVWKNLPSLRAHWLQVLGPESKSSKSEIATIRGFLRIWKKGGPHEYYTALMLDVLHHFEILQKTCQKSMATVCDIAVSQQSCLDAFTMMESNPFPGGVEERLLKAIVTEGVTNNDSAEIREVTHSLVSTKRCQDSVKIEIVQCAKEFLSQRLSDGQDSILHQIKSFLKARTAKEMIDCTRNHVEELFGEEYVMLWDILLQKTCQYQVIFMITSECYIIV